MLIGCRKHGLNLKLLLKLKLTIAECVWLSASVQASVFRVGFVAIAVIFI